MLTKQELMNDLKAKLLTLHNISVRTDVTVTTLTGVTFTGPRDHVINDLKWQLKSFQETPKLGGF